MCYVIIDLNRDMNIIFDLIYTSAGLFSSIRNLKSFIWYDLRRNLPFNFYLNRKNKNHFFQTCTTKKPLTNNYFNTCMIFLDLYLIISKCMFHSKTKRQTDKTQRSSLTLRRIQCYVYVQNRFIHTQFTKKYKREILGYQKIPPSEESSWPTLTAVHNLSN